jgi:hypothetical protein
VDEEVKFMLNINNWSKNVEEFKNSFIKLRENLRPNHPKSKQFCMRYKRIESGHCGNHPKNSSIL